MIFASNFCSNHDRREERKVAESGGELAEHLRHCVVCDAVGIVLVGVASIVANAGSGYPTDRILGQGFRGQSFVLTDVHEGLAGGPLLEVFDALEGGGKAHINIQKFGAKKRSQIVRGENAGLLQL